ncbi:MAG: hypothetical protein LC772_06890 [Chloroflexi bacterium]|nr:hypothetical protein [Chloroflexota bacterium]
MKTATQQFIQQRGEKEEIFTPVSARPENCLWIGNREQAIRSATDTKYRMQLAALPPKSIIYIV